MMPRMKSSKVSSGNPSPPIIKLKYMGIPMGNIEERNAGKQLRGEGWRQLPKQCNIMRAGECLFAGGLEFKPYNIYRWVLKS